jgi:hypothetical protein
MPDSETVKSKRDLTLERLKGRYPDASFDDDEQLFGRIYDDYDQYDQELAGYKEREGKFSDLFTSDPRSARLMNDWRDGDDPAIALMRLYGDDLKEALDDPEKQQQLAEANKEYMKRVGEEKSYYEKWSQNMRESANEIDKLQSEGEYTKEQIDTAIEWAFATSREVMLGKFSRDTILFALKAQNYDNDVERASEEGEVRGRNTRAKEQLRKPSQGDGTANLDGKNGVGQHRSQNMPNLGVLDRYGEGNLSIFERGGEKRTPIRR